MANIEDHKSLERLRQDERDVAYMKRALELAELGRGYTAPNPMVGAVIVDPNGEILGEGYHEAYGQAHAEVNALAQAAQAAQNLAGCTLYVTLEPCSHHGKTPPCADAIIKSGISRVVVAHTDPNPLVGGRGLEKLRAQGINVDLGICEEEARALNAPFIKYMATGRPLVTLKTAMTLDGKIATSSGQSQWISCPQSRELTHKNRHYHRAIMVGIGTILADDPKLTARIPSARQPVRIVVDTHLRIPLTARVISKEGPTYIACGPQADPTKKQALEVLGCRVVPLPLKGQGVDLGALMEALGSEGIDSLFLEGGAELNFAALKEGIVDRIMAFVAPKIVGGAQAKGPVGGHGFALLSEGIGLKNLRATLIGQDVLLEAEVEMRKDGGTRCLQD